MKERNIKDLQIQLPEQQTLLWVLWKQRDKSARILKLSTREYFNSFDIVVKGLLHRLEPV